ncbi:MAG: hypothetical protein JNJ54_25430 [Myxococcaceae bacterium]|nr:hypothetical protein [Myxococcaceae bacterium]
MNERASTLLIVQRLVVLSGGDEVRRKAAARLLAELDPTGATTLLHEVQVLARRGRRDASEALHAFTRALELEAGAIPHVELLQRAAALSGAETVELLFSTGEAAMAYDATAAARADAKLFNQPLGVLKSRARLTQNPDEMARFAVASNAAVVRELLRNARLTEDLVVRIAARRPARPEPLVEIWRSERWTTRPAVRRALAFNPYLPVEVGARIVPLLSRAELIELSKDTTVHASLKAQAQALLSAGRAGDEP